MAKINCWEFMKCGREPGGSKVKELGVCVAALEQKVNELNKGKNGGRVCWGVAGTLCGGKIQGSLAHKIGDCLNCEFYKQVIREEADDFVQIENILSKLNK